MRKFSIRPALTIKGRQFKGLRGWAGKPFHPPLTDIPVAAYIFGAGFDIVSRILRDHDVDRSIALWRAGTYVLIGGYLVGLLAVLTGWADWHRSSKVGTQARRTINTHAWMMIIAQVLVLADIIWRVWYYDYYHSTGKLAALTTLAAIVVAVGSTYGGSLVFDYGFNVETSGDHPVWHESEVDVFPGKHEAEPDAATEPH